jgi:hypothetical protein
MTQMAPNPDIFRSVNYRVATPDGTMHVTIMDDNNGQPIKILIHIGKAGTAVSAWAYALAEMISLSLESGTPYSKILEQLSSITSGATPRIAVGGGAEARSGVEGLWIALMRYRKDKFDDARNKLTSPRIGPSIIR